jgi:transposase
LYPGNTSDPKTFAPAVETMKVRFGAREVVMVGDRGMIKKLGREVLDEAGFRYVTALTDPQIRKLLAGKVLTPDLFDEQPVAVEHQGRRLILRCNPATRQRERQRRLDQWRKLQARIEAGNARLAVKPRAQVQTLLKQAQEWLAYYGFEAWIQLQVQGRKVLWSESPAIRAELELLDGCYVLETDLPADAGDAVTVNRRYMGLMEVERDFRTMKTGLLEMRPIFLRKAKRTTGHALVTMLALKLARALDRKVAPLGLTVEDATQRLGGVRLVSLGAPELELWRLPQHFLPPQQEILNLLPPITAPRVSLKNTVRRRLGNPRRGRGSPRK